MTIRISYIIFCVSCFVLLQYQRGGWSASLCNQILGTPKILSAGGFPPPRFFCADLRFILRYTLLMYIFLCPMSHTHIKRLILTTYRTMMGCRGVEYRVCR